MRTPAVLGMALLLALAGCAAPVAPGGSPAGSTADGGSGSTPSGDDNPGAATPTAEPPPDPETDVLGWEDGYWHNATLAVDNSDGLSESELAAVVARAKARVEEVRGLEFDGSVNVTVRTRGNFSAGELRDDEPSEALRRFDNAKFEALFLVGGSDDSIETQDRSRNASVGGYYDPGENAMVIVADGTSPTLGSEQTLAHELVHALQDQHFDIPGTAGTRDGYNGRNGLVEGDPTTVHHAYMDRCDGAWTCIEAPDDGGDGAGDAPASIHLGIYLLEFFPYSDGPDFVASLRNGEGWDRVNAAYQEPPGSATEVIYPERYGNFEPREVGLTDDVRAGWQRVRPPGRSDHARLGQSALAAMLGYTLYDEYNRSAVVGMDELLNLEGGGVNATDPIDYDLAPVRGWTGDRLHVYHRDGDLAYRWRLTWDSPAAAQRFAGAYRALLDHWGGRSLGDGRWRVPADSPFTGGYHVSVRGDVVTVAHAPSTAGLADVDPAAR